MFPMLDRETREGVQLYLAFLRSGITGEMEEAITLGNVSSVLVVGVWGMQPALLHLPCCAGTGIHFRSVWSLQGNSVLGLGMSGGMDQIEISQWKITIVSLAACHSWWGWLMLMIKKLESELKRQGVTIIYSLIIREVLGSIEEDTHHDQRQPNLGEGSHWTLSSDHTPKRTPASPASSTASYEPHKFQCV